MKLRSHNSIISLLDENYPSMKGSLCSGTFDPSECFRIHYDLMSWLTIEKTNWRIWI